MTRSPGPCAQAGAARWALPAHLGSMAQMHVYRRDGGITAARHRAPALPSPGSRTRAGAATRRYATTPSVRHRCTLICDVLRPSAGKPAQIRAYLPASARRTSRLRTALPGFTHGAAISNMVMDEEAPRDRERIAMAARSAGYDRHAADTGNLCTINASAHAG